MRGLSPLTSPVDIRPDHLRIVRGILREHLPVGDKVWVFGSRANWTTKDSSDLDIALEGENKLSHKLLGALKDAFEDSTLPYTVDVVDLNAVSHAFKQLVKEQRVALPSVRASERVGGAWREVLFSEAVLVNPPTRLDRGAIYPFVDMAAVNADSRTTVSVEERTFKGSGSRFQSGDTLMARITPCLENGKIARYQAVGDKLEAHGSTEFIVIRGRADVTDTNFAYYLTKWEEVRNYAIGQMTGTSGRQRVPLDSLDHLTVPLPPLPEQRAIAHVLGTLDDKIELNRRMNETLGAMARALFKSWFVDFEPVRAKMEGRWRPGESLPGLPAEHYDLFPDRLADSALGDVPEGWEVGSFKEVVIQLRDNENPATSSDAVFSHFSIPAHDEGQMPKRELGESIKSAKTRVPPNVVLLSKLNPEIERVWLVDVVHGERAICSTEFLVLRPHPPFQRSYVYCLARSPLFRQQMESLVTGTSKSHQRAPANAILSLRAVIPPARVIEKFELSASELLNRGAILRKESHALAAQRDALLPGLVSGRTQSSTGTRM